jgi:hypothetical protein
LIDALESLAEKENAPQARKTLSELVRLLYEGKSFSQALGQLSAVFPPLYVALVQSSEKTGAVGEALGRYVSYRQRMDEVRQKIVSASTMLLLVVVAWCCFDGLRRARFSWYSRGWGRTCRGYRGSDEQRHSCTHQGGSSVACWPSSSPSPCSSANRPFVRAGPPDRKTPRGAPAHLHV